MRMTTNAALFKIVVSLVLPTGDVPLFTNVSEAAVPFTFNTRPGTNVTPYPIPPVDPPINTNLPTPTSVYTWESNSLSDVIGTNHLTASGSIQNTFGGPEGSYYTNCLYWDGTLKYLRSPDITLGANASWTLINFIKLADTNGFIGWFDARPDLFSDGKYERAQQFYWNNQNNAASGIGSIVCDTFDDVFMPTNAVNLLTNWHAFITIKDSESGKLVSSIDGIHWWTNTWNCPNNTAPSPFYIGRGLPPFFGTFSSMIGWQGLSHWWNYTNLTERQVQQVVNLVTNAAGFSIPLGLSWPAPTNEIVQPPPPPTNVFYIAANGGSPPAFNGSSNAPWSLPYALAGAGGQIRPGITNYLLAGTYTAPDPPLGQGFFRYTYAGGIEATQIVFKAFPGHRVILSTQPARSDSFGLEVTVGQVQFEGLEFDQIGRTFNGYPGPGVIYVRGNTPNVRFINCWIHDVAQGFTANGGGPSRGLTADECVYQYVGDVGSGSLDHAIYSHNLSLFTNFFNDMTCLGIARQALHFRVSSGPAVWDFQVSNAVVFASESQQYLAESGSLQFSNMVCENSVFHQPRNTSMTAIAFDTGNHGSASHARIRFRNNIFSGGSGVNFSWRRVIDSQCDSNIFVLSAGRLVDWQQGVSAAGVTFDYNSYFYPAGQAGWAYGPGSTTTARTFAQWQAGGYDTHGFNITTGYPTNIVRVYPSKYAQGRGRVAILNYATNNTVSVDLSPILRPGDTFRIAPMFNLRTNCVSGTYNGGLVAIPMTNMTYLIPSKQLGSEQTNFFQMGGIFTPTNKLEFMCFKVEKTN